MGTSIGLQFHLQIDFKIREFEAYKLKRTKEVVMTFNSTAHFTGKVTKVKTDLLKVPAMVSSRLSLLPSHQAVCCPSLAVIGILRGALKTAWLRPEML